MATRISGPYQDPDFNGKTNGFCVGGGKSNASKAQKKGGHGGRKPLGEISNIKASQTQALKKDSVNSRALSQIKEEKVVKTGGRKPLGDISNFRKPSTLVASNKNTSIPHLDIRDEGLLHDHKKCIKAQCVDNIYEDMDYFLETIGLAKDSSVGLKCSAAHPSQKKVEPGNPLMLSEELGMVSEISEMLPDDSPTLSKKLWLEMESSPAPRRRPKSPSLLLTNNWIDHDFPELALMESPVAQKP